MFEWLINNLKITIISFTSLVIILLAIFKDILKDWQTIIAVLISTGVTLLGTHLQYLNNRKIKEEEKQNFENAVVTSIYEELTGLYNCYDKVFQDAILNISNGEYIKTTFTITQDFFTIYHNNASNIGKINKQKIRNGIVQIYILLNSFIENLLYYKSYYALFMDRRKDFLGEIYSAQGKSIFNGLIVSDSHFCEVLSVVSEINNGKYDDIIKNACDAFQGKSDLKLLVLVGNDKATRDDLIKQTNSLKNDYKEIRKNLIELTEIIKEEYKIDSSTMIIQKAIEDNIAIIQNTELKENEKINS